MSLIVQIAFGVSAGIGIVEAVRDQLRRRRTRAVEQERERIRGDLRAGRMPRSLR